MALFAAFVLPLAVMTGVAHAGAKPQPANANQYGKGYAGLTAEWLEWTVADQPIHCWILTARLPPRGSPARFGS
jgi:hypothetical protein